METPSIQGSNLYGYNIDKTIRPIFPDFFRTIETDSHLRFQLKHVPKDLQINPPILQKYEIGSTELVFCNFSSYLLRMDDSRTLYIGERRFDTYTSDNCHITLYPISIDGDQRPHLAILSKNDHARWMKPASIIVLEKEGWKFVFVNENQQGGCIWDL